MVEAAFHFPKGFRWGTATAAHQVEGQQYEQRLVGVGAAARAHPARAEKRQGVRLVGRPLEEDMDRAAEAGQNAHRFSVEWSRIEPAPGRWDEGALDLLPRDAARACTSAASTPMVTLHHFSNPLWLPEQGGWENGSARRRFEAFTRKTVAALTDTGDIVVHDQRAQRVRVFRLCGGRLSARQARRPRGLPGDAQMVHRRMPPPTTPSTSCSRPRGWASRCTTVGMHPEAPAARSTARSPACSRASSTIWSPSPSTTAGCAFPPARTHARAARHAGFHRRQLLLLRPGGVRPAVSPRICSAAASYLPDADLSETGFIANIPDGMVRAIRWAHRFGVPIYITENGVEDAPDRMRPRYLIEHLLSVWRAVELELAGEGLLPLEPGR